MTTRYFALLERHSRIDDALRREASRRHPDPQAVNRLKKLKLAIKDRMATMIGGGTR